MRCNDGGLEEAGQKIENMGNCGTQLSQSLSPVSNSDPPQALPKGSPDRNESVSILQRTSSLGVADSYRLSRFRPASLSVNVPSSTQFLSSLEVVGNSVNAEMSSPAPVLASGASASLFSVSPQFCFYEKSRRRSGERVTSAIRTVGAGGVGCGGSAWDPPSSFTINSSLSHRSSLLLVPQVHQAQTSNPPSTASPAIGGCSSITSWSK